MKILNKELQIQLFSILIDYYPAKRGLDIYYDILNLLEAEDRLSKMTPTEKAILEANSNSEDSPQCRLDKFVLGECGANESTNYYERVEL